MMTIDFASIGHELKKPVAQIESAVRLLDEGNTIPFITRFRKDQTGGLNEEQLLIIKQSVARLRSLAERKAFIVKSIDSQNNLTEELSQAIAAAHSSRQLEDIYLPFKPKKQTLAATAKQLGLEPLANDIFEGREPEKDLASRATDFVRVDLNLNSVDEVIAGVGHILADRFSNDIDLRNRLRILIADTGKLTTRLIAVDKAPETIVQQPKPPVTDVPKPKIEADVVVAAPVNELPTDIAVSNSNSTEAPQSDVDVEPSEPAIAPEQSPVVPEELVCAQPAGDIDAAAVPDQQAAATSSQPENPGSESASLPEHSVGVKTALKPAVPRKKKKKKKSVDDPYREFRDFSCPLSKMPYHKTLAINRGEKNGRLKVRIAFNETEFMQQVFDAVVPAEHPFGEFMRDCVRDSMTRLVIPSVEREMRREITEAAEQHAVRVFAKNLKNLLLQSPVRDQRVLSIDPGYKRGCSIAVVDSGGQVLEHSHVFVVGNEQRRQESQQKIVEMIQRHSVKLIAIGNGAACREAEQLVSDIITAKPGGQELKYAIVNEAGASVYSTSEVGREELPAVSPAVRSAVSIGRRLIDPLSELVKISPASIGVGLYQHDVKARHLAESLDDVVQFCVNRVGVDVNTASPSLLKYVSGLNQLTARRVYEFRQEHGPFRNREQLKQVASFGDATFIQSAGFLRIHGGDQPFDTTCIHPESYDVAKRILERVNASVEEVFPLNFRDSATSSVDSKTPESEPAVGPAAAALPIPESDGSSPTAIERPVALAAPEDTAAEVVESDSAVPLTPGETATALTETVNAVNQYLNTGSFIEPALSPEKVQLRKKRIEALRELNQGQLATELNTGQLMIRDIIQAICRPEYDPRQRVNQPVFRSGIIRIDDLKKDMCLDAQVVNVVDFGIFVDIGLGTSCLVHVSQLANHFIRDPHRFFAVGDVLKVWVTEVDLAKRRVTLTAVQKAPVRPKRPAKFSDQKAKTTPRPVQRKSFKKRDDYRNTHSRKTPPRPAKPITEDMLKGAEPMRSFSDLAQFFDKQPNERQSIDKTSKRDNKKGKGSTAE